MKNTLIIGAIFLSALLCGCMLKYEDVSKEAEYAPLLNTCYSLRTNMLFYGMNLGPGYGKDINVYVIKPMSLRTTGPEIISEDTLKAGAVLEVQSIRRSITSVPFEGRKTQAVVEVIPCTKTTNVPVVIGLKYILSTNYVSRLEKVPTNK
jgi:hypothetical protein